MNTNIYFIRHAETVYRPEDHDFNRPLTEKGRNDAKSLTKVFQNISVSKIYSSPYFRAINSVKDIAEDKKLDIELLNDLRERKVANHYIKDFFDFSSKQWQNFNYSLSGGESLNEVKVRGLQALKKIISKNKGENIIAAGHGTWLGIMLNHFDKKYDYNYWRNLKTPDIFKFEYKDNNLVSITRIETKQ